METPSFGYLLVKTVIILLVFLGIMGGMAFLLRKYQGRLLRGYLRGRSLHVVERCALSPRHSLVVVEVGGVRLLVGVSPQGISLLRELPPVAVSSPPEGETEASP